MKFKKVGFLDLLVIILSAYVLIALLLDAIFKLSPEISKVLDYVDFGICIVFFVDFCVCFYRADNKFKYMQWGWIDLISCIPTVNYLRFGRTLRLFRLLRVLRAFRSTRKLVNYIFMNRAKGALTSVTIIAVLLIIFSSVAILQVETDANSNIKTAEDALWWAYTTITTVGYGDRFPVTTEGRLIGVLLMTGGVGLFGTFTAYLSSWFLKGKIEEKENRESDDLH